MAYKIPEEKISEVREATDIVDLISGYLTLKKRGKNYFGLCPFHQEDTPSFSVDPTRQMYHCFGCHKGGNAITFLMDYEKMSFVEAVRHLADKAGIQLQPVQGSDSSLQEKESLYFANKFAAEFFYNNLMSSQGKKALTYLENRGLNRSIIRKFGLGYSLPEWDGLIKHARSKSVSLEVLFKAGLVIKKDTGNYYDRFRGRVMTPIINLSKKVVGFGGRILVDEENSPKYINSPETLVYQKSLILFGLYQTRESIREKDQAILVEGYTDLLSLYQNGFPNIVATAGTALTLQQAHLIKRYTDNIVLLYDGDAAGSAAAMRSADIFLTAGLEVKIAVLPHPYDPDSFIRTYGSNRFQDILKKSVSFIQFKIYTLNEQYDKKSDQNQIKIMQVVLESISKIKNSIRRELALKEVAEHFGVDESAVRSQLKSGKGTRYRDENDSTPVIKDRQQQKTKYDIAEENIVKILLENQQLIKIVTTYIEADEFKNEHIKKILNVIFNFYEQYSSINVSDVIKTINDPSLSAVLSELLAKKFEEEINRGKLLNDCLISLKERTLEAQLQNMLLQIKSKQHQQNEVNKLMKEYQLLREEKSKLKSKNFVTIEKNA